MVTKLKFSEDVLLAIMEALRKGITDGVDISDMLRNLEMYADDDNKLRLIAALQDVWK